MELPAMNSALSDAIKKGKFVPFFGAASPSIRKHFVESSENEKIWGRVFERFTKLQAKILDIHGEVKYKKYFLFLEKLAIAHDIKLKEKVDKIDSAKNDDLLDFQVCILEFLLWCSDKVAERIQNNAILPERLDIPVIDFNDLSDKEKDNTDCEKLIKAIFLAIKKLKKSTKNDKIEILLPLRKIEQKFEFYVCKIFCEKPLVGNSKYQIKNFENFLECELCLNGKNESNKINKKLTLGELRWLKELLWWSSRYDVPIYPTSSELAHYISYFLEVPPIADIRDYDLSLVAGAVNGAPKNLRDLFKEIEEKRKLIKDIKASETAEISHEFFKLIAKYLVCLDRINTETKVVPIAVTTNYDSMLETEIEQELKNVKNKLKKYRVVFPVWIDQTEDSEGSEIVEKIDWICRTIDLSSDEKSISYSYAEDLVNLFKTDDTCPLPTLIKIHGAPCIDIDSVKTKLIKEYKGQEQKISQIDQMKHFVILSESNYLNSLPIFMGKDQINDIIFNSGKSIWFLGYSLSDWDVRVMMLQSMKEKVKTKYPKGEIKDGFENILTERFHGNSAKSGAKYYILKRDGFDSYFENVFKALKDNVFPINQDLSIFYNYLLKILKIIIDE
jgi:hypothetical protein